MVQNQTLMRGAQRLALSVAVSALASAGLTVGATTSALAEFEIEEGGIEKGEKEFEYRGAVHWGFPKAEREAAAEGEGGGALEEEEEGEFLRQSHDFEFITASPNGGGSRQRLLPTNRLIAITT